MDKGSALKSLAVVGACGGAAGDHAALTQTHGVGFKDCGGLSEGGLLLSARSTKMSPPEGFGDGW